MGLFGLIGYSRSATEGPSEKKPMPWMMVVQNKKLVFISIN